MAVKTLTITEEAYNTLKRLKRESQSFSQIIIEVTAEKSNSLGKFFGILRDSKKELNEMKEKVKEGRKEADKNAISKIKKLQRQLYGNP